MNGLTTLQATTTGVTDPCAPAANLGAPASGNTLIDAWTNDMPAPGISTVTLGQTAFGPGTYDLQIRGDVLGPPPSGGYGGSVTFTPVPAPAALPLLLSGLALLG